MVMPITATTTMSTGLSNHEHRKYDWLGLATVPVGPSQEWQLMCGVDVNTIAVDTIDRGQTQIIEPKC